MLLPEDTTKLLTLNLVEGKKKSKWIQSRDNSSFFLALGRNICSRTAHQKSHPIPTITPFIPRLYKT